MSELPQSWAMTTPVAVAEPIRGVTYKKEQARNTPATGFTALLRANNIQQNKLDLSDLVFVPEENVSQSQMLKQHDVVIAMSSGSISVVGKSAQVHDEPNASFGAFCGALRPTPEIDPRYFGHFLKSEAYRSAISNLARGVNINNLKWSHFEEIGLPLAPLPEQKRIADKLDRTLARVEACRDRLDRLPALLKRFRQSILAAATSGRLTEDWRSSSSGPQANDFPKVEFGAQLTSIRSGSSEVPSDHVSPFPVLRSSSVRQGKIDFTDIKYLTAAQSGNKKDFLENGDVLFTRLNGTAEYVGNCAVVENTEPATYQYPDRLFRAKLSHSVLPKYCVIAFSSPKTRQEIETRAKSTAGHKRISIQDIKEIKIPLPGIEEQHEIVRRVETLFAFADRLEARLATARKQAEQLTPALLAKAFRGELVPQDPNDEPATELLKRLATTRSEVPKTKRGRKAANA